MSYCLARACTSLADRLSVRSLSRVLRRRPEEVELQKINYLPVKWVQSVKAQGVCKSFFDVNPPKDIGPEQRFPMGNA